jgi:hypothetical protein
LKDEPGGARTAVKSWGRHRGMKAVINAAAIQAQTPSVIPAAPRYFRVVLPSLRVGRTYRNI